MIGNQRSRCHLNRSTRKNQIHDVDHFPESKGSLFHVYDNQRCSNDQMMEGEYGTHTKWGKETRA